MIKNQPNEDGEKSYPLFKIKLVCDQALATKEILALIKAYHHDLELKQGSFSKQKKYLSFTLTLHRIEQPALDSIYQSLSKHPQIKWVL